MSFSIQRVRLQLVRILGLMTFILLYAGFAQAQFTISVTSLPDGKLGSLYAAPTLTAINGTPPITWQIISGAPPLGISLSTTGAFSGTPAISGSFGFTVMATDSSVPTPKTATQTYTIRVPPVITTTSLSNGVANLPYSETLDASSSTATPFRWSIVSGSLPAGLRITDTANGIISGTPTQTGTFSFTVQVLDSAGQTATKALSLLIQPQLTIPPATLPTGTVGTFYAQQVATGPTQTTWSIVSGLLPPGLGITSSGSVAGTPTVAGSFTFTLQGVATNPTQSAQQSFTIVISTTVTITTASLPHGIQNVAYSQQLQATGTAPLVWGVTSGNLPLGLTLTTAGVLQGTPTTTGAQSFTVTVTDAHGSTGTSSFTLTVDPPIPALSIRSLPASLSPTQASDVALVLAAPNPSFLSGQLILTFTSTAENPSDDPATQFSTGSRSVPFTVPANATDAVFASPIKLLVGTVTGTVSLTANFDNGPSAVPVATVQILPTPPQITNVVVLRTSAGLDVQTTGYSPARRVTTVDFIFDVKNGSKVQQVVLSRSVDADFTSWYKSTGSVPFGSAFSFVQSFNIQGDTTAIQDVSVKLTNAQGSTTSSIVKPQ